MNSDSNKLLPAYRRFYKTPVKGKRTVISIALDQPKISAKSNVNLTFPKLSQNVCINPNSIYISALLENANTKSWFKNNYYYYYYYYLIFFKKTTVALQHK